MPVIRGTAEADTLIGTESNDVIYGGDGVDRLEGGAGDDRLYGGAGAGPYGDMGDNTLIGGAGDDRYFIQGTGNMTTEEADGGLDRVYWMPVAGEQSNWYVTQAYVEFIYVVGNDAIPSNGNGDYFIQDEGYDGGNDHTIFASDHGNSFQWVSGRDVFYGGDGDDYVVAQNPYGVEYGADYLTYHGGNGDDILQIDGTVAGFYSHHVLAEPFAYVHFNGGVGFDSVELRMSQTSIDQPTNIQLRFADVEYVALDHVSVAYLRPDTDPTPFDLTLSFATSVTNGGAEGPFDMSYDVTELGHNVQLGATHDHMYIQGLAYDSYWGAGQFVVNSGAGNDWVQFDALDRQGQGITTPDVTLAIQLGAGNDMATSHGDRVTISGGAGSDFIEVTGSDNTLSGGLGDDEIRVVDGLNNSLSGGDGNDLLFASAGDDRLYGGAGNDRIDAGDGEDLIYGGAGADVMSGGAGADRFVFLKPDMGSTDTIRDFFGDEGDRIDLRALAAGVLVWRGDLAFTGNANEVRVADGLVQVDANGDGVADLTIDVGYDLVESDFWL